MTILTNLPVTLTCGTPVVVTLDKAQLITDFAIVDPYWMDSDNWVNVRFMYGSDVVGVDQKTKMVFAGNTSPLNLPVNAYNGNWLCSKILIWDGLERQLILNRVDFPVTSEFDFASVGGYDGIPDPNYVTYNNLFDGGATAANGKVYKGGGGNEPLAVSNTSVGQFAGNFNISFKVSNVDTYGVLVGLSSSNIASPAIEVQMASGSYLFRDSNGATVALGSYNTVGDVTIKMVFNAQTIQIFKDDVEVLPVQALFAGFGPTQNLYPSAIASLYAGFSSGISTTNDIIKETFTL